MDCSYKIERTCDRQHKRQVACSNKDDICSKCIKEDKDQERRIRRDIQLEKKRMESQDAYARELQEIQDEIDRALRTMKYMAQEEAQKKNLAQQRSEAATLKETAARMQSMKSAQASQPPPQVKPDKKKAKVFPKKDKDSNDLPNNAQEEWEYLKQLEGAKCEAMDELMDMIGLEEVKMLFLDIKGTIDTKIRQKVALASQRFGCSLLGNPGTG